MVLQVSSWYCHMICLYTESRMLTHHNNSSTRGLSLAYPVVHTSSLTTTSPHRQFQGSFVMEAVYPDAQDHKVSG